MNIKLTDIFSFIRYCVDDECPVPAFREEADWEELFLFMKQQTLVGIGFGGVEKMRRKGEMSMEREEKVGEEGDEKIQREGIEIPRKLLLRWFGLAEKIRRQNRVVNERAVQLMRLLEKEGMRGCVLKGQGNAIMYPDPYMRASGDIDVWVDGGRKEIMAFVKRLFPSTYLRYHHVELPVFKDVTVEVHFMPSTMNNLVYNRRLQKWFEERKEAQFGNFAVLPDGVGKIAVPTVEFNLVYQMSHMMHHFFDEGIGLRQMMDYYYLLKKAKDDKNVPLSSMVSEKELEYLGMKKFASAVMYVEQTVFGLGGEYMIVKPCKTLGELLLREIIQGGNFGKYSNITNHGMGVKYFLKSNRNLLYARHFPAEALSEPLFRTCHFFWRLWHKVVADK